MRVLRQIHACLLTRLLPISTLSFSLSKIVSFCALSSHGDLSYAGKLFPLIPNPNIFSWNSMIRGLAQIENPSKEPILFFKKLIKRGYPGPNSFTMAFVLKACAVLYAFEEGKQIHSYVFRSGFRTSPFVQTALVNFYAKCDQIRLAEKMFDEITDRNLFSWSTMISGYSKSGLVNEAMGLFREMQKANVEPDEVTLVSLISSCASAGALDTGKWVHAYIEKNMIKNDLEVSTALVNMYAKCGFIDRAKEIFNEMPVKDTKAWSSMIIGFACHGLSEDALKAFDSMVEAKVIPNHVTFIGVLSACAHRGLVSEGRKYWSAMLEFGLDPSVEHYNCMIDLLCRVGLVFDAFALVQNMKVTPNPIIWRTLLVGCKKNKMLEMGETVAHYLFKLEPLNADNYILLSNLYASVLQWEKMSSLRKTMKEKGIKAVPGWSSIEINGFMHEFVMGDWSHPETKMLREFLREVSDRVGRTEHRPSVSEVLHNVVDEREGELA